MSKGSAGIPSLHLTTLNKLVDMTPNPAEMVFSNMFPSRQYPSDQVEWEVQYGSVGMTPFVAPGSIAPTVGGDGIGYGSASCAYMKEKTFLDEMLLNNLRKVGTDRELETAQAQIVRRLNKLKARCANRREWMVAKALCEGAISYQNTKGMKISVSFGIPTQNLITLTGDDVWGTGTDRNPSQDLNEVKAFLADEYGYAPSVYMMNSNTQRLLMFDAKIQDLAKTSAFNIGNPMGTNATRVIAEILGIGNLSINDAMFEVESFITGDVTGGSTTTIYVEDSSDFEIGGKVRFVNSLTPSVWETKTISAVDKVNSTITVSVAPTNSYVRGRDRVIMKKKYIPDNKILMFTPSVGGESIIEIFEAPHGLQRRWGMTTKTWDDRDPEGTWMMIEDKCFPVLYRPEAVAVLTVA